MWQLRVDDLTSPLTLALIDEHLADMRAQSPSDSVHALESSGLAAADVTVFTAWDGAVLGGMAALRQLDAHNGEVKSMRTSSAARRSGLGRALLRHVMDAARAGGMTDLWLETGSGAGFSAARALYASEGFVECGPFGDYRRDPLSVFMMRRL